MMTTISLREEKKWNFDLMLMVFWIIALGILVFSFYQQYVENIKPCELCTWQRFIYFLIFGISPIGFIQRFNLSIRYTLNVIFLLSFCLATYHSLIQFGWLADRCTLSQEIENIADFMKMLEQPKISCTTARWKLFGFSASIYNSIFSFLAFITLNIKISKGSYGRKT